MDYINIYTVYFCIFLQQTTFWRMIWNYVHMNLYILRCLNESYRKEYIIFGWKYWEVTVCQPWVFSLWNGGLSGSKGNREKISVAFCLLAMLRLSPTIIRSSVLMLRWHFVDKSHRNSVYQLERSDIRTTKCFLFDFSNSFLDKIFCLPSFL